MGTLMLGPSPAADMQMGGSGDGDDDPDKGRPRRTGPHEAVFFCDLDSEPDEVEQADDPGLEQVGDKKTAKTPKRNLRKKTRHGLTTQAAKDMRGGRALSWDVQRQLDWPSRKLTTRRAQNQERDRANRAAGKPRKGGGPHRMCDNADHRDQGLPARPMQRCYWCFRETVEAGQLHRSVIKFSFCQVGFCQTAKGNPQYSYRCGCQKK